MQEEKDRKFALELQPRLELYLQRTDIIGDIKREGMLESEARSEEEEVHALCCAHTSAWRDLRPFCKVGGSAVPQVQRVRALC